MTNEEKIVLLEKLTDNDAFLADIAKAESKDQLQEVFANYGLELTRDEVDAFVAKLNSTAKPMANSTAIHVGAATPQIQPMAMPVKAE